MKIKYINVAISFVFLLVLAPMSDVMAARPQKFSSYKGAKKALLTTLPADHATVKARADYRNQEAVDLKNFLRHLS
jgi:hypothetical protein